jgi:parallel beta-helix repeat protein
LQELGYTRRFKMSRLSFVALFFSSIILSVVLQVEAARACTVMIGGTAFGSVQAAVNAANPGDTVSVSGTPCNENVLIRNDKVRVFLVGSGGATITGNSNSPTLDIRGKAISVSGFMITGGSNGIEVHRGSNAVINDNVIENMGGSGIVVYEVGFAAITNNTIRNNTGRGIMVSGNSNANIGFNSATDSSASPNTIQNNGEEGIAITGFASARIAGNTISGNGSDGIGIFSFSYADIAGNTIDGNSDDGISIGGGIAQLGSGATSSFFDQPNATTVNNGGFGIACNTLGFGQGKLGTLNGDSGVKTFPPAPNGVETCFDATTP